MSSPFSRRCYSLILPKCLASQPPLQNSSKHIYPITDAEMWSITVIRDALLKDALLWKGRRISTMGKEPPPTVIGAILDSFSIQVGVGGHALVFISASRNAK
jgi:hypothetical protein